MDFIKRGELTSTQIIVLITLILAFTIILFVIVRLYTAQKTDEEVCRLSVLTRATTPTSAQSLVPLKCKTQKICLVLNKGEECKQFTGEENVKVIVVPKDKQQAADLIEKTTAESMLDCWKMMGEGKLDLFSGEDKSILASFVPDSVEVFLNSVLGDKVKPRCVICHRIAISEQLQKEEEILRRVDINEHLENERPEGSSKTYLKLFTDEQMAAYPKLFEDEMKSSLAQKKKTDQIGIVFMQVLVEKQDLRDIFMKTRSVGLVIVGAVALSPIGAVVGVGSVLVGGLAGALAVAGYGVLKEKGNQVVAAGYCGEFNSKNGDRFGCSLITPIDYNDVRKLKQLCYEIESIP